jgi:hypothetical protein
MIGIGSGLRIVLNDAFNCIIESDIRATSLAIISASILVALLI